MTVAAVIKTAVDGTVSLIDGTGSPLTLTIRFSAGDLNIQGITNGLREAVAIAARGKTRALRKGAPTYPTVSFSAHAADLAEVGTGTIANWDAKTTPFASRTNTISIGDLDCYHVKLTIEGTAHGDGSDQTITCKDVHCTWSFQEGDDGNKFSMQGTIYGDIVITDGAASPNSSTYTAPRES